MAQENKITYTIVSEWMPERRVDIIYGQLHRCVGKNGTILLEDLKDGEIGFIHPRHIMDEIHFTVGGGKSYVLNLFQGGVPIGASSLKGFISNAMYGNKSDWKFSSIAGEVIAGEVMVKYYKDLNILFQGIFNDLPDKEILAFMEL